MYFSHYNIGFKKPKTVFCLYLSHEHLARDLAGYTASACQVEPLIVSLEHPYLEVHMSTLITGQRGELKCLLSPYWIS